MVRSSSNLSLGIFMLRFGLGIYIVLWALNKIISPETSSALFSRFYYINFPPSVIMIIGALELVLGLLIILGFYKNITYSLGLVVQIISVVALFIELLVPFGDNIFFYCEIPILLAFVALFLLKNLDNRWTLSKKPKMFS